MAKITLSSMTLGFGAAAILLFGTFTEVPALLISIAYGVFFIAVLMNCIVILQHMYRPQPALKAGWMIDPDWITDAVFVSDLNGKVKGVNAACQKLTGLQAPYKTVSDLCEPLHAKLNNRSQADDIVAAVLSSPEIKFSDTLLLNDDRTIERTTRPIEGTDQRIWILRDVTQNLAADSDHAMHRTMLEEDAARTAELAEQLYYAKAELEAKQAELTRLANTDSLTGLLNRRRFSALAQEAISIATQNDMIWTIMMDIDHFKRINDTYGHAAGDIAIRDFANIATEAVGNSGFVGRMGGEEFAAILPACSLDEAFRVAEKIRKNTAQHQTFSDAEKFRFTASIGVAQWQPDEVSIETTIDRADQALYTAKTYGRNRVVGYEA